MKEEQKHPTLEEINYSYDSYQEDLQTRDLHLKLLVSFDCDTDIIISMLQEAYSTDQNPTKKNEP